MSTKKQPNKTSQDTLHFNTSSGIKSIVGKDLITDRYIAIFELVKNSYDAKATDVIVSFNSSEAQENSIGSLEDGKIFIVDNGKGMNKADLKDKWLFLAYSEKQEGESEATEEKHSPQRRVKNRVFVGSKGIGRFSSDSLGSKVKIYTKVANENIEHQLSVDWDEFDVSLKNHFEHVGINYKSTTQLSREDEDSYTIIEISNLRQGWSEDELNAAKEKLRRLKNPFVENDDLNIYFGLDIFEFEQGRKIADKYKIQSNIAEVLHEKSISILGVISPKSISISLHDRGDLIYEVGKPNDTILKNIENIEIDVNYLTTSAKSTFSRRMGLRPVNYGNIFIYRNGFHVSPYGEEFYDIFGLNLRKSQGYNRYLANRELIGFINILDKNNYFKETSSRNNGFIQNGYFNALENLYLEYFHKPLERYVSLIRWGEDKETKKELMLADVEISDKEKDNFKKYISRDGFEIIEFDPDLDFEKNKPEKIIDRIIDAEDSGEKSENLDKDSKKLKRQFRELDKEGAESRKAAEKADKKRGCTRLAPC